MTLDILAGLKTSEAHYTAIHYDIYCRCRGCSRGSVLNISLSKQEYSHLFNKIEVVISASVSLETYFNVDGYLSIKDFLDTSIPKYLPSNVEIAFKEGASCLAIGCYNASGAMFRLAIDLATKSLLPEGDGTSVGPNRQQRKQLNERLIYLFGNGYLPKELQELANCVKDDGNDGAHDGTLKKIDAEDLLDFATELFERMFTEPEKLRLAQQRREERRQ